MKLARRVAIVVLVSGIFAPVVSAQAVGDDVDAILAAYADARGGTERWRAVDTIAFGGTYATFSQRSPFTLIRKRPNRYRIDLTMLGEATTVARDREGPWWQFPMLQATEPGRVQLEPYVPEIERTARFAPALLERDGVSVSLQGPGDVDGIPTIALEVTFADGSQETWHLDPETHLEVAIDAMVHDFTQGAEPIARRTYFGQFRAVEGLVLPHRIEHEFGARLEVMEVETVEIGTPLAESRFALPR